MKIKSLIPISLAAVGLAWSASAQTASATVTTPAVTASTSVTAPTDLAFGVRQVLKLQQAGLGTDVLINYVNGANLPFAMRADDIVYLHQMGVPQEVITAMMNKQRNSAVAQTPAPVQQSSQQASVNPPTVNPPQTTTVVTQPPVVYSAPPTYVYGYPSYSYYDSYPYYGSYGWGAPLSLNFGFGWGGGWHGGGWHGGGWHGDGGWHGGGGGWHGGGGHHH